MNFPPLGSGLSLRRPHYKHVLENETCINWFEIISENFMPVDAGWGDPALDMLEKIRENYPIVLHGVSLSIGSADPIDNDYLKRLDQLIKRIEPAMVSDHLCWSSIKGKFIHDLLPLPYTADVARWVTEKLHRVQDILGRQVLLENVSSYITYADSEMTEWEFLNEIASASDCGILLDINNVYVSSQNHGFDPLDYLNALPGHRIGQFHLAGHSRHGQALIDTHDEPVCQDVWDLYKYAIQRFGPKATNIERDEKIPDFEVLEAELAIATQIQEDVQHAYPQTIA